MEPRRTLEALAAQLVAGGRLVKFEPLAPDTSGKTTHKVEGYGEPIALTVEDPAGGRRAFVLHTASANDFGHDRRSDRAQQILLAFDTFGEQPAHARAHDVGAIVDGELVSLRRAGEFYLVTEWAPGRTYAEDLRRVAIAGACDARDLARCDLLAAHLTKLHGERGGRPEQYRRAVRDLVGHGEGIFGISDGYADDTPAAPPSRLARIEEAAVAWRWKLRGREARVTRTHGDFHPFNILFDDGDRLTLLDASRGGRGDPADDVVALAINFLFFAVGHPGSWPRGFAPLWRRFWHGYLDGSGDRELLSVVAPFWAWRTLVVCCPRFYPALSATARDLLLGFAERVLAAPRFSPEWAEELLR